MSVFGYAFAADADKLEEQYTELREAGCVIVRGDIEGVRDERNTLLAFLRPGDTLVTPDIACLADDTADFGSCLEALNTAGANLRAIKQAIDAQARPFEFVAFLLRPPLALPAVEVCEAASDKTPDEIPPMAQCDADTKVDETPAPSEPAQTNPPVSSVDASRDKIRRMLGKGKTVPAIATQLGLGRSTVYRVRKELADSGQL